MFLSYYCELQETAMKAIATLTVIENISDIFSHLLGENDKLLTQNYICMCKSQVMDSSRIISCVFMML